MSRAIDRHPWPSHGIARGRRDCASRQSRASTPLRRARSQRPICLRRSPSSREKLAPQASHRYRDTFSGLPMSSALSQRRRRLTWRHFNWDTFKPHREPCRLSGRSMVSLPSQKGHPGRRLFHQCPLRRLGSGFMVKLRTCPPATIVPLGWAGGVGHRPSAEALDIVLLRSQHHPQKDRQGSRKGRR